MGMKACVKAAHLIDSDENLHCFTLPLSRCYIKISVVSQSRCTGGISWLFNISTHSLSRFFLTDWQLAPTGLSLTWSLLTRTDTDWTCWLMQESRNTNTDLKLTQTVASLYTSSTLPTNSTMQAAPVSTMAEQLHPQQQSHGDTIWGRYATYEISRNCPIRKLPNQNWWAVALADSCCHRILPDNCGMWH